MMRNLFLGLLTLIVPLASADTPPWLGAELDAAPPAGEVSAPLAPPAADAAAPWPLEIFTAAGYGDEGDVYAVHIGTELPFLPERDITLAPQLVLGSVRNTDGAHSLLTAFDLMGRWQFWERPDRRLYLEAGAGAQYTGSESFPRRGTHFNFRLRAGIGGEMALDHRLRLHAGVGWLHVSNAGLLSPNNGHDGPMFFLGLRREW